LYLPLEREAKLDKPSAMMAFSLSKGVLGDLRQLFSKMGSFKKDVLINLC
jgi:hypothetical protein